jgi:hypothetical protein
LLQHLENVPKEITFKEFSEAIHSAAMSGISGWHDLSGMVINEERLSDLTEKIKISERSSIREIRDSITDFYQKYEADCWQWTCQILMERPEINNNHITRDILIDLIRQWKENSIRLNNMILSDAKKEFDPNSRIGFGLGGDPGIDFEQVRGIFEHNSFVKELQDEIAGIERKADKWIENIGKMK